jgi:hypothetical protein
MAGTFHAFHNAWITHLQEALNNGGLPAGYYALGEQRSGDIGPDVLTLQTDMSEGCPTLPSQSQADCQGMIAVAEHPPKVSLAQEATRDAAFYIAKRRTLVIYHAAGDRIVALIEIVSPGNKHSRYSIDTFLTKLVAALDAGYHLLVIDLFPPARQDPNGIHGLMWEYVNNEVWQQPIERPLGLVAYCAKTPVVAYVEPTRVGVPLASMPLFLTPTHYVNVPLEETYMSAWHGIPERWRRVIEQPA